MTAPVADALLIVPWLLIATNPPIELLEAPVTEDCVCAFSTVPLFVPTNPPILLFAPVLVTVPPALKSWIRLFGSLIAAKPPSVLLSAPMTAPVADALLIVPWVLKATNPPIELLGVPVTVD